MSKFERRKMYFAPDLAWAPCGCTAYRFDHEATPDEVDEFLQHYRTAVDHWNEVELDRTRPFVTECKTGRFRFSLGPELDTETLWRVMGMRSDGALVIARSRRGWNPYWSGWSCCKNALDAKDASRVDVLTCGCEREQQVAA